MISCGNISRGDTIRLLANLIAMDHVESDMLDRLRQAAVEDAAYVKLVDLV